MSHLTFILGGARSGKSSYAEHLATRESARVLYIATGQESDDEMRRRIAEHRQGRSPSWQTLELPTSVGRHLLEHPPEVDILVLDCLTLLVSNLVLQAASDLGHPDEITARSLVQTEITDLLQAIHSISARWLVVSNEVGYGLVPRYPVGRVFRDLLGWSNQQLAEEADDVLLMVAGIPVPIGGYRVQSQP